MFKISSSEINLIKQGFYYVEMYLSETLTLINSHLHPLQMVHIVHPSAVHSQPIQGLEEPVTENHPHPMLDYTYNPA